MNNEEPELIRKEISISPTELLNRVANGEPLRWVPCKLAGIKSVVKGERVLAIGSDLLDEDSAIDATELVEKGCLIEYEDDESGIIDYTIG